MLYSILNQETKNWWYHKKLRDQGNLVDARKRERASIRGTIKQLREVLAHGGYLGLHNAQWSLNCFKHKTISGASSKWSLSGYYGIDKFCYLEKVCKRLNIPVIDSRKADPFDIISLPMIDKVGEGKETSMSYVTIERYCQIAKEKGINLITHNIGA